MGLAQAPGEGRKADEEINGLVALGRDVLAQRSLIVGGEDLGFRPRLVLAQVIQPLAQGHHQGARIQVWIAENIFLRFPKAISELFQLVFNSGDVNSRDHGPGILPVRRFYVCMDKGGARLPVSDEGLVLPSPLQWGTMPPWAATTISIPIPPPPMAP